MAEQGKHPEYELSAGEAEVVNRSIRGFMDILNSKDAKAIAAKFDENGIFVGAAGMSVGRKAIEQRFAHNFERRFKNATMRLQSMESFRKVGQGAAAGGGACLASGIINSRGEVINPLKSNLVMTLVNKDGEWLFSSLAIVNETAPGR